MDKTEVESTRKALKIGNNKRNNINSIGCDDSSFVDFGRNNNKFSI